MYDPSAMSHMLLTRPHKARLHGLGKSGSLCVCRMGLGCVVALVMESYDCVCGIRTTGSYRVVALR